MFSEKVQKRMELLNQESIVASDKQLELTETNKDGEAELVVKLKNPCLLFKKLEKNKLGYFRNAKCADYVIFENVKDSWIVHILELKRTVKKQIWQEDIKNQFRGAIQNAMAIAGVLGISIELSDSKLYTAFRNDKINDEANPVKLRVAMHERDRTKDDSEQDDWNQEYVAIDFLETAYMQHQKIRLHPVDGSGQVELA